MNLNTITFCNQSSEQINLLKETCLKNGLELEILGSGVRWTRNAIKLRLLNDYLNASNEEDDLILVVDAFDVVVNDDPETIISKYKKLRADIVFSAEANYYFREADLSLYYWWYYPRDSGSIYHYLNSGTFIGTRWALRRLLQCISVAYEVDYRNDEQLINVRSDQYLYSRFFVDYKLSVVQPDFSMKLDVNQELFGCSGGRMAVTSWPSISHIQDYLFFKYERRMLKTFSLKEAQENCRDLFYSGKLGTFRNSRTGSEPPVIHLPGTYHGFGYILGKLKKGYGISLWDITKPVAYLISLIAYFRSVINYLFIKHINEGRTALEQIFPVVLAAGARVSSDNDIVHTLRKKASFVYVMKAAEARFIPQVISHIKGKRIGVISSVKHVIPLFEALGLKDLKMLSDKFESDAELLANLDVILVNTPYFSNASLSALHDSHKNLIFIDISEISIFNKASIHFPKDNPFTVTD